jgi:hypothetical protein
MATHSSGHQCRIREWHRQVVAAIWRAIGVGANRDRIANKRGWSARAHLAPTNINSRFAHPPGLIPEVLPVAGKWVATKARGAEAKFADYARLCLHKGAA